MLFLNAIAILNEKRFLKKCIFNHLKLDGFDTSSAQTGAVNETVSSKNQIIMMVFTLRSIGKCNIIDKIRRSDTFKLDGHTVVAFRMT